MMVYGVAILLFLLGAVTLLYGRLNHFRPRHPRCAACSFNLTGLADAPCCPECGAAFPQAWVAPGQFSSSRRERNIVRALLVLALLTTIIANRGVLVQFVPAPVLAKYAIVSGDTTILRELSRRLAAGSVSAATAVELTNAALAAQGDTSKAWAPEWGEIIEAAYLSGAIGNASLQRYFQQAVKIDATLPARVTVGDTPRYSFEFHEVGPGFMSARVAGIFVEYQLSIVSASIGEQPWPLVAPANSSRATLYEFRQSQSSAYQNPAAALFPQMNLTPVDRPPGSYPFALQLRVAASPSTKWWPTVRGAPPVVTWTTTVQHNIEVRSPDEPLSDPITDPATLAEFKRRCTIRVCNFATDESRFRPAVFFTIESPSANMFAQIELADETRSWIAPEGGFVSIRRGRSTIEGVEYLDWFNPEDSPPGPAPKRVRVILHPHDRRAANVDMLSSIAEPIVFEDVPVEWTPEYGARPPSNIGGTPSTRPGYELPPEPPIAPRPWKRTPDPRAQPRQ